MTYDKTVDHLPFCFGCSIAVFYHVVTMVLGIHQKKQNDEGNFSSKELTKII